MSEWRILISAQCVNSELNVVKILNIFVSFILISKPRLICFPIIAARHRQFKPVFHFTISLAALRSITLLKTTFPVHFYTILWFSIYNIPASSPGLGYILIYVRGESVGQSYSSVGHQYTRVGQTINLSFT